MDAIFYQAIFPAGIGKPVDFTPEEINTFNFAIQDISKRLRAANIQSVPD